MSIQQDLVPNRQENQGSLVIYIDIIASIMNLDSTAVQYAPWHSVHHLIASLARKTRRPQSQSSRLMALNELQHVPKTLHARPCVAICRKLHMSLTGVYHITLSRIQLTLEYQPSVIMSSTGPLPSCTGSFLCPPGFFPAPRSLRHPVATPTGCGLP